MSTVKRRRAEVPELEGGFVTLTRAAEMMDVSRTRAHALLNRGDFKTARRIGTDERPVFIVRAAEIEERIARRANTDRVDEDAAEE